MAWQPIETAPKDGTIIVAVRAEVKRNGYSIIFWDSDEETWAGYTARDEKILVVHQPTHWMPLPQTPLPSDWPQGKVK